MNDSKSTGEQFAYAQTALISRAAAIEGFGKKVNPQIVVFAFNAAKQIKNDADRELIIKLMTSYNEATKQNRVSDWNDSIAWHFKYLMPWHA